jgi:hypothetical protein
MSRYLQLPNYTNNLKRHGFTDDDVAGPSDRLIDAIVVRGSSTTSWHESPSTTTPGPTTCASRCSPPDLELPVQVWRDLADAFSLTRLNVLTTGTSVPSGGCFAPWTSDPGGRTVESDMDILTHTLPTNLRNDELRLWVDEMADLCRPDAVVWCDGSQEEYDRLCQELVDAGTFIR